MSCVIKSVSTGKHFAVIKGSPEAVGNHLANKPAGYDDKAAFLSKEGYRVIALGYKTLSTSGAIESARDSRSSCETVVNEASLTGESVPQMKEGLSEIEDGENLSMKFKHKMSVAYAGTKMLQCKGANEVEAQTGSSKSLLKDVPNPPDNGAVCFVLRTGFSSAQGKLVRMIEGSQEKVKGHEKETGLLLLLLFFFAVASSSYVLYHGLQNDKRSKYELLLHCILIVTSVIPPELPMQMALAVNTSCLLYTSPSPRD